MKAYLYVVKLRIQTALAYRFNMISTILVQCIVMFAISYFWIAVYGETESVLDISKKDMLTYTSISILMGNLLTMNVQYRIVDSIRNGNVALDILKPVNVYGIYLAEDIGDAINALCQKVVPLLIISTIIFGFPKTPSGVNLALFLVSFIMSYLINWFLAALLGLCAFQTISMGPMMAVKGYIIKLLSGSFIPLWFFPQGLQNVLEYLPFVGVYQIPLGIYIGKYAVENMIIQIAIQSMWVLVLLMGFIAFQKKMARKVLIQGG